MGFGVSRHYLSAKKLPDQGGGHLLHVQTVHAASAAHEATRPPAAPGPRNPLGPVKRRCLGDGGIRARKNSSPSWETSDLGGRERREEHPPSRFSAPVAVQQLKAGLSL